LSLSRLLIVPAKLLFFFSFDTSIGGLILSDQFLQIVTKLDSSNLYGFGEHEHHTLRHDMNWKKWAMYSRDQAVSVSYNN
jgi:hypothetical protein